MTKRDLIEEVARRSDTFARKDIEAIVNTIFGSMLDSMARGDRIEIRSFGTFSVRDRSARQGRNPRTGADVHIPARRVPFFTAGKELRQRVDGGQD
jgi:integration host factor subunit beta